MFYDADDTSHASLYLYGDYWYVVNAVIYTVCAMRDNEVFWFMPCNGRPQGCLELARAHYFSEGCGSEGCISQPLNLQAVIKYENNKCKNSFSGNISDMDISIMIVEDRNSESGSGSASGIMDMTSEGINIESNLGLLSNFLFPSPNSVTLRAGNSSSGSSSSSGGIGSGKDTCKDRDRDRDKDKEGSGSINNGSYTRRSE